MNLSLEDVLSHIRKFRPSILDVEAFHYVQRAEQEVQTSLGGLRNSKFAHLFQAEVEVSLTGDSPSITLPNDAGLVIRAEMNGSPVSVLPLSQRSAVQNNFLHANSAVRDGSRVTFYGIPAAKSGQQTPALARVVYETGFESPIFVDGFYAKVSDMRYGYNKLTDGLMVLDVVHPARQQFSDEMLKGATLRMYDSRSQAREWSIFTNFWEHPLDPDEESRRAGAAQRIVLNDDLNNVSGGVNYPGFDKFKEDGFPIRITRLSLPPSLREAIVLWVKAEISGDPKHRRDYEIYIERIIRGEQ